MSDYCYTSGCIVDKPHSTEDCAYAPDAVAGHRDILRREFERIARLTDEAYAVMIAMRNGLPATAGTVKTSEAIYKDWATILLRYHDALERIEGKEPAPPPVSMKGLSHAPQPDVGHGIV